MNAKSPGILRETDKKQPVFLSGPVVNSQKTCYTGDTHSQERENAMKRLKGANRTAALILTGLALAAAVWLVLAHVLAKPGTVAEIWVDGKLLRTIALDKAPDAVFSIKEETGRDVEFEIRDHRIRFLHSDCPDKICVNTGFIHREFQTAVCMPNRVSIVIVAP
jgi:hypothetical protein